MAQLEVLLRRDYHAYPSPELGQEVARFAQNKSGFLRESIEFIGMYSRASRYLLRKSPNIFDGSLQNLFDIHLEGIERISTGQTERRSGTYSEADLSNIEAFLHDNLGTIARMIYIRGLSQGMSNEYLNKWLVDWFEHKKIAADMLRDAYPKDAAFAYGLAGDAAFLLFDAKGGEWRNDAIYCYENSLRYFNRHPDPKISVIIMSIRKRKLALELDKSA